MHSERDDYFYRAVRPAFETLRPILPLPVIPAKGGEVRYYHVFNHLAEGTEGFALWEKLMATVCRTAWIDLSCAL